MYIEKLEIQGFGKLCNLTINFNKGFNMVYGLNESGKTTIQWFIKGMLFGLKGGRAASNGVPPPLKKYKPWDGRVYGGAIEYRLDNNELFRIERDFESGRICVYNSMFKDVTSEFYSTTEKGAVTAEKHILLNEACFEKTGFVKQMESGIDETGRKELLSRITNVMETGFEDISFRKAEKALRDSIKEYVGSDRTTTRPLDRVVLRLEELENSRSILVKKREEFDDISQKLELELKALRDIEKRRDTLQKIRELLKLKKEAEKFRKQKQELRNVLEEALLVEQSIRDASKEIENHEDTKLSRYTVQKNRKIMVLSKQKRVYMLGMIIFPIISALLIISDFFIKNIWIKAFAAAFIMLAALAAYMSIRISGESANADKGRPEPFITEQQYISKVSNIMQLNNLLKEKYGKASLLSSESINSIEGIEKILQKFENSYDDYLRVLDSSIEKIRIEYQESEDLQLNLERFSSPLSESELESLELLLEYNTEKVSDQHSLSAQKIIEYKVLLRNLENDKDELQRIDEEIEELITRKRNLESLDFSLKTALDVLTQVSREIQRDYIPGLNSRMGDILKSLSSGRYNDIRADEKLYMRVAEPETGRVTAANILSGGTVDQIYLALRLSMAEMLEHSEERVPFIMDEIFAHYDDSRTSNSLRLLEEISLERQIILFTCKGREVEIASRVYAEGLNLIRI